MKIILSSLHELREEWVNLATARTFGQFEEPVCRFKVNKKLTIISGVHFHLITYTNVYILIIFRDLNSIVK